MYNFQAAFTTVVLVPVEKIPAVVYLLTSPHPMAPMGTSFAITSEGNDQGFRYVYMTPSAERRLEKSGILTR